MSTLELRLHAWAGAALAALTFVPGMTFAANGWSIDAGIEPSTVDIGTREERWRTTRIQGAWRDQNVGGLSVAVESQKRERETDGLVSIGGFRRLDDWTLSGQISGGVDRDFIYRYSIEPQISRRLFGNFVGQAGYMYRKFDQTRVHLGTIGGTQYYANGEVEVRVSYGRNKPSDRAIKVLSLRGVRDDGSAFSYGGSATVGRNIYDAINVPGVGGNRAWIAGAFVRYRLDANNSFRLDATVGREEPSFRQRGIALSYRRTF